MNLYAMNVASRSIFSKKIKTKSDKKIFAILVFIMETYKNWLRTNWYFISFFQNFGKGITWFVPENFLGCEVAPEAVESLVGLITTINEHIAKNLPKDSDIAQSSKETGEHASSIGNSDFPWSLCLSATKELDILVEASAEHYFGKQQKWSFISASETLKVLFRLILLHKDGYTMQLDGGETRNNDNSFDLNESNSVLSFDSSNNGLAMLTNCETNRAEDNSSSSFSREENAIIQMHHRSASRNNQKKSHVSYCVAVGEVLFILRPLIYVLLIRRYSLQSWKPWLVSLSLDIAVLLIYSKILLSIRRMKGRYSKLSKLEMQELKRRQLSWALYVMKDPFFCKHTRYHLEKAEQWSRPFPIIGKSIAILIQILVGMQARYAYISAS